MNRRAVLRVVGTGVTIGVAGCSGNGNGGTGDGGDSSGGGSSGGTETATATPTNTAEPTETVTMRSENVGTDAEAHYFDPIGLVVERGTTVTFNAESGIHTTSAYDAQGLDATERRIPRDADGWDSKRIDAVSADDPAFKHSFEIPGTYDYFCRNHAADGMVGRIVVEEGGGPAEGSMPPHGSVPETERILDEGAIPYEEFSE